MTLLPLLISKQPPEWLKQFLKEKSSLPCKQIDRGEPHTDISHYDEKHSHKIFPYLMDGVWKERRGIIEAKLFLKCSGIIHVALGNCYNG